DPVIDPRTVLENTDASIRCERRADERVTTAHLLRIVDAKRTQLLCRSADLGGIFADPQRGVILEIVVDEQRVHLRPRERAHDFERPLRREVALSNLLSETLEQRLRLSADDTGDNIVHLVGDVPLLSAWAV